MISLIATETVNSTSHLWEQFIKQIGDMLQDTKMWTSVAVVIGRIILILLASRIALRVINRIIDHTTNAKGNRRGKKLRTRRVQTVGRLLKNTAIYTINFIVILLILGEFHIQLAPLLAGAGIFGLAIGFGAQSLVKDIITGFFIILEDQFAVGDVIQTGNFKGTVEMIGLRATRIKSWTGEVHIIPNGLINEVSNFSVNNSLAVVDIFVAYEDQVEGAMSAIRAMLPKIEDPNLVSSPELLGIQAMASNEITLRIIAECKPNTHAIVSRRINAEVKRVFESEGMSVPYQRMLTVHKEDLIDRGGA
ncbi:MAG: mechanosensitive ion channel family protein [Candidatus Cohnella colombiensis]|uniref:Mechanosensitive ion channel family protein n=1 Tax=Candidatus Cohnella colombiensis TaxID=3121368 RepID=A0AA95JFG7_9BACL|nr:MAG: mechanosensitive ion channel family protein [Cohnella sp.]